MATPDDNPSAEMQTLASAYDGYVDDAGGFSNNGTSMRVGKYQGKVSNLFAKTTGWTIPKGAKILACHLSIYSMGSDGNDNFPTKIFFEKTNTPADVTSWADYISRELTTEGVEWTTTISVGWYDSPSLVAPMQELIDAFGFDNQSIQVMWKDNGCVDYAYHVMRTYDYYTHTDGVKLYIEFEAPGPES